ncbi:MAG: GMC family oxidoreductase N-terminal domain-containing protein, partial [Thermomicrobiales bacterium]|nr:GMC family oxidoreductase N-terminal domain-containing protein [Thermomicrobiales bacterium]
YPDGPLRTYEQARVMGGGSSINGQMANRGQPADYDEWAEFGADGWTWNSVLPYFKKLERDLQYGGPEHGTDGPLPIRRVPRDAWPAFSRALATAVEASGLPWVDDQNVCPFDPACFSIAINNENERRVSSAVAYLDRETRRRPNLTILAKTRVRRLVVDGARVTGVEVDGGEGVRMLAAREVIISAGSIHSPAMLLRAGIGPAEQLRSMGIPVVADRPGVGANLHDHPMISLSSFLTPGARLSKQQRRHIFLGLRWSSGLDDCLPTDMYAVAYNRGAWHPVGERIGGILVWVNKSYSKGYVRLASRNPDAEPDVMFDLLGDERDLRRMREGVRYLLSLFDHHAVRAVAGKPFPTAYTERYKRLAAVNGRNLAVTTALGRLMDGPESVRDRLLRDIITDGTSYDAILHDDDALDAYLRATVTGIWHATGTCRMGHPDDPHAVCDPEGRVIGVQGLRVCDGSVMPTIPCANPNIPIMMVAERMSDLMLRSR